MELRTFGQWGNSQTRAITPPMVNHAVVSYRGQDVFIPSWPSQPSLETVTFGGGKQKTAKEKKLQAFRNLIHKIHDLSSVQALLYNDQVTGGMPEKGIEDRGHSLETIASLQHKEYISPKMDGLLRYLRNHFVNKSLSPVDAAMVREYGEIYDYEKLLPAKLVKQIAETTPKSTQAWEEAKTTNNYSKFAPHLEQLVILQRKAMEVLRHRTDSFYDRMLDSFHPKASITKMDQFFEGLRGELLPLLAKIQQAKAKNPQRSEFSFLTRPVDPVKAETFCQQVLKAMGFDFSRGVIRYAMHPMMQEIVSPNDIRVMVKKLPKKPTMEQFIDLLSTYMHEGGHALFEQGAGPHLHRLGMSGGPMGIHESQSRLWENMVGKSYAFWQHYFPILQKEVFPQQLKDVTLDEFYRAVNRVEPSLIRVESDELTYNLHIMLRYEMEKALVNSKGDLKKLIATLPQLWNEKTKEYLGLVPPTDAQGILQDVHWSDGSFGYFPTYTIGNVLAAQFYARAKQEVPDLEKQIAKGNLQPLHQWLKAKIYHDGQILLPDTLVRKVTGKALNTDDFLQYLWTKYSHIYGFRKSHKKAA